MTIGVFFAVFFSITVPGGPIAMALTALDRGTFKTLPLPVYRMSCINFGELHQ